MATTELMRRIQEMLAVSNTGEREQPAPPEAVALSALLLTSVGNASLRRRVANSTSPQDCLTWLAVDRVASLLSPERYTGMRFNANQAPSRALRNVVQAAAQRDG